MPGRNTRGLLQGKPAGCFDYWRCPGPGGAPQPPGPSPRRSSSRSGRSLPATLFTAHRGGRHRRVRAQSRPETYRLRHRAGTQEVQRRLALQCQEGPLQSSQQPANLVSPIRLPSFANCGPRYRMVLKSSTSGWSAPASVVSRAGGRARAPRQYSAFWTGRGNRAAGRSARPSSCLAPEGSMGASSRRRRAVLGRPGGDAFDALRVRSVRAIA